MNGGAKSLLSLAFVATTGAAMAAPSPFGVGLPDPGATGLIPWVAAWQSEFYRDLTAALRGLKDSGQAFPWLAGVSFAYGVVHAAGPGHGKVVIASYLLANEEKAKRGVGLAFLSAMVQALVAVAIVGTMAAILNLTSIAITETARLLEVGSYVLILGLGLYLLAKKVWQIRSGSHLHVHGHSHQHGHSHAGHTCGQHNQALHARRGGLAAILSVGLRPCSGALIVLVFALAQGIFWAGVASTFLMSLGTAVTVAVLAALAVGAKDFAAKLAGGAESRRAEQVLLALEFSGALLITVLGGVLLLGALAA